jgi:hypothetical protein
MVPESEGLDSIESLQGKWLPARGTVDGITIALPSGNVWAMTYAFRAEIEAEGGIVAVGVLGATRWEIQRFHPLLRSMRRIVLRDECAIASLTARWPYSRGEVLRLGNGGRYLLRDGWRGTRIVNERGHTQIIARRADIFLTRSCNAMIANLDEPNVTIALLLLCVWHKLVQY